VALEFASEVLTFKEIEVSIFLKKKNTKNITKILKYDIDHQNNDK
jgi:hypothetical protein